MNCRTMGPVALAVAFLCGCGNTGKPETPESKVAASDLQISRSLIGTWAGEEGGDGAKAKVTRTYQSDGLFQGQGSKESSKGPMAGTWLVENGVLTEKVQKGR